jgi:3-hydroxy-9,10-secoandrosta-1,3,5(10)-triene-9,17-dione monooxygenase
MQHIELVDDWHVLGLRGTGSCSLVLKDVFIPEHRTILFKDLLDGTTPGAAILPEYNLLRAPRGYLVPFSLPVVMFTLAHRALTLVPATLRTRISRGTKEVALSEVVQLRLGEAAALIDTAILIMQTRRTQSIEAVDSGTPITPEQIVRNRRDIAFAAGQLRRGVETLMEISGARSVYDTDPLQALVRDIMTIGTHVIVSSQSALVPYGQLLLGLPPTPVDG